LAWRQGIIEAVAEARRRRIPDEMTFRELKKAGLTDGTAKKIMKDAFYCDGSEMAKETETESPAIRDERPESFEDYVKRKKKSEEKPHA
jgi:hypothetical protein